MIKLMFIKNISRLDTIRFDSASQRDLYFNNMADVSIDALYPPHFQNKIQVSIEDLSPSTKVNYLSLYYENRYYYYFIDNINYINEGVYELLITMDTITTFMFDLRINNAILERHSIKRWNTNGTINRDYIRENLSSNVFQNMNYNENKFGMTLLIFKCRQEMFFSSTGYDRGCEIHLKDIQKDRDIIVNDGTLYLIFPLINIEYYTEFPQTIKGFKLITRNGDTQNEYQGISFERYKDIIAHCMENPHVYDAFICCNDFANSLFTYKGYSTENGNRYLAFYIDVSSLDDSSNNYCDTVTFENVSGLDTDYLYPIFSRLHTKVFKETYHMDYNMKNFVKNTEIFAPFNICNIPQLIDDNYFRLYFGEKLGYTSFPLHLMKRPTLYLNHYYDVISNNRCYSITEESNGYDVYLTNIVNQTKEYLSLYGDALANYTTTNYGTLTSGVALAKQNALWNGAKQVANSKSKIQLATAIGDTAMSMHNIDMQLQVTRENAEFSPDNVRQGNTYSSDLCSNVLNRITRIDVVSDLLFVAKRYEQYGYLINNEVIDKNLYSDFNTRYYYNVVKFTNANIELDYINNNTLIQNIIARLENGLRLWNIFNLDIYEDKIDYYYFIYDNVENEFIE